MTGISHSIYYNHILLVDIHNYHKPSFIKHYYHHYLYIYGIMRLYIPLGSVSATTGMARAMFGMYKTTPPS